MTGSPSHGQPATTPHARGGLGTGPGSGGGVLAPGSHLHLLSAPKLRRLVSRLKGCLSALAPEQSQAMVLRTGLGLRHGYTREQVARILRVTLTQEGRIEQQAVVGLTRASAHGRCAHAVTAIPSAVLRAVNGLLAATSLSSPTTSASPSVAASPGRQASSRASRGSGGRARSKVGQRPPAASASIFPPGPGRLSFLLIALTIAVALGLAALWLLIGGRGPHPVAAGAVGAGAPTPTSNPTAPQMEAAVPGAVPSDGIEAFELGLGFVEKGDMAGAEAAFRHADEQGHPSAASNLGVLLEHRGDVSGAETAYRRADERGDATGAFNLGALLEDRNAPSQAEAAYRRAIERAPGSDADPAREALNRLRTRR